MRRGRGSEEYEQGDEPCDVECKVLRKSGDGVLIMAEDEREIWLPMQYVEYYDGGITIPEWLAMDRGLI
jgi:hypothetical protein